MENRNYWEATRKILLVVNFSSLEGIHEYRNAIKAVGLNVNDCTVLALVASKKERQMLTEIHSVVYASEQEISIMGRWKNEGATKALSRFWDLVIVLGDYSPKVLRQLRKAKYTMALGVNTNADFLTIDLKSEETTPDHLLNFAKRTLEKII